MSQTAWPIYRRIKGRRASSNPNPSHSPGLSPAPFSLAAAHLANSQFAAERSSPERTCCAHRGPGEPGHLQSCSHPCQPPSAPRRPGPAVHSIVVRRPSARRRRPAPAPHSPAVPALSLTATFWSCLVMTLCFSNIFSLPLLFSD